MEKFNSIKVLDAAPYENVNVLLKKVYGRTSVGKVARLREKLSTSEWILEWIKRNGRDENETVHSLLNAKQMQTQEEAGFFLPSDGLRV